MTNSDDLFDDPGVSDLIKWENYSNRLLLIQPLEEVMDVSTIHGTKNAMRANVHVLQETDSTGRQSPPAEVYSNTLVFPGVLQGQIRSNIGTGRYNLGRLSQGVATKGNPPWQLADPTDKDRATAREYLNRLRDSKVTGPSSTRQQPTGNQGQPPWQSGGGEPPF